MKDWVFFSLIARLGENKAGRNIGEMNKKCENINLVNVLKRGHVSGY